MSLTLITPPAVEPVTLSEVKLQCGFGPMEDTDQLREQTLAEQLRPAMAAARQMLEGRMARAIITQTWKLTLPHFPCWHADYAMRDRLDITIPLPTFQTLDAFTYLDSAGDAQDMMAVGGWGYQIVSGSECTPARLRSPLWQVWPFTLPEQADAVSVTFTCGFGATPSSVPYAIRAAVKLMAQYIFEGSKGNPPAAIDALIAPYIVDVI